MTTASGLPSKGLDQVRRLLKGERGRAFSRRLFIALLCLERVYRSRDCIRGDEIEELASVD